MIVVLDINPPLLQDHASNSSHSSLRGSAQTSIEEEHPVNPVVSISFIEITPTYILPKLSFIKMLLSQCRLIDMLYLSLHVVWNLGNSLRFEVLFFFVGYCGT